jgi:hypothetical protein
MALMDSNEKTKSSRGIELYCHGPSLEDKNVMNTIMLEEESDIAATVKTLKDFDPLDGVPRQDNATASGHGGRTRK